MNVLQSVGWALVHFVWQGTAIALVLAISLVAARRAPASFRYALSAAAMLLMIVVPVVTVMRLQQTARGLGPAPAGGSPPSAAVAGLEPERGAAHDKPNAAKHNATPPTISSLTSTTSTTSTPALHASLDPWLPWIVALWALGVFVLSVRLLGGFLRARQLKTQGTSDVPESWHRKLFEIAQAMGITSTVRIMQSALVAVPMVIGWLRPVVLLPGSVFTGLTPQQLEAILAHELAHIRRHDYVVNLIQAAIETVLFYHPAVWWVGRRLRAERELCCDDLAVAICGDARGYATALVDMERLRGAALAFALGAGGGGGGSLVARVRRLIAPSTSRSETAPRWAAGALALVAAVTVGSVSDVPNALAQKAGDKDLLRANPVVVQGRSQPPDTVLKAPDSAASLADRWAWAERQARVVGKTGYWVGYTIKAPESLDRMVYIDRQSMIYGDNISMSGRLFGEFRGFRFPGQAIGPLVGGGDPRSIKLLFEYRGTGRLARVHVSSFELPADLGGHALLWLGSAEDAASLPLVESLYNAAQTTDLKEQVIDGIGIHGTSALVVPALERHLAANEPNQARAQAAEWLGSHPVPQALNLLARLARTDRSNDVRREAAEAVGEMKLPAATDTLVALARTLEDRDARREAVEGLGQKTEPKARTALESIAREDRTVDVQREAVETLGEVDGPQGIASLKDIARNHPNVDVRREAVETLGETLAPAEGVALLIDILNTERNPDVAREAVETLGEVGNEAAHAAVLRVARTHEHPDVRREAIETLGQSWPSDETVEQLSSLARQDRNPDVAREAVETLGEMDGGLGMGVVIELAMTHPHPDVRREAVETVGEHATPAEAIKVLRDVLRSDASSDVRREAVETLGEMHDSNALAEVIKVARANTTDSDTRREAIETLGQNGDPKEVIPILTAILNEDTSQDVQEEALETLIEMDNGAGIPAVIQAARSHKNREIRQEALKKLAESDDPRARAIFERALGTP